MPKKTTLEEHLRDVKKHGKVEYILAPKIWQHQLITTAIRTRGFSPLSRNTSKRDRGLNAAKASKDLGRLKEQHIDEIKIHGKVELIGEFLGTKTETKYRCLVHDEVWPASPENIKQGHGLQCCQREGMGAGAEIKKLRAKEKNDSVIEKLASSKELAITSMTRPQLMTTAWLTGRRVKQGQLTSKEAMDWGAARKRKPGIPARQ